MAHIEFSRRPVLERPVLVAAFQGWNDAGEAASGAVTYLIERLGATTFARVDPEEFLDFQVNRPTVRLIEGESRVIEWPSCEFHAARHEGRDLVLFSGVEPNVRWRTFIAAFLDTARSLGIERMIGLGAFLADVPHSRPFHLTGSSSDPREVEGLGLSPSRYEGPTGIVGALHDAAGRSGFSSLSLWAAVPHYAPAGGNPKATLAILDRLQAILGISVDPGPLPEAAQAWERTVTELVGENEALTQYVRRLEEAHSPELSITPRMGESLAAEVERFLREQDGGPERTS